MTRYYKLLWAPPDLEATIRIPGFVWGDRQTAEGSRQEYEGWTCGLDGEEIGLFEFEASPAYEFPLAFDSQLSHRLDRPAARPLNSEGLAEANRYFEFLRDRLDLPRQGLDHVWANEDNARLFMRVAATLGVLKSARNRVLDEYFCGIEVEIRRAR